MIEKRTEAGDMRRIDIMSRLKDKQRKFKNLERLKHEPGWAALKSILEDSMKAHESRARMLLQEDNFEDFNHAEARASEKLRGQIEAILDAVENPDKAQADITVQLKTLEEQMKVAQEA